MACFPGGLPPAASRCRWGSLCVLASCSPTSIARLVHAVRQRTGALLSNVIGRATRLLHTLLPLRTAALLRTALCARTVTVRRCMLHVVCTLLCHLTPCGGESAACLDCGHTAVPKLPRVHHCGRCGRCHLRLDHHCDWVNNCIGAHNHKFFMGLCLWQLLASAIFVYVYATTLGALLRQPKPPTTPIFPGGPPPVAGQIQRPVRPL